jgi:hypothetical protein
MLSPLAAFAQQQFATPEQAATRWPRRSASKMKRR